MDNRTPKTDELIERHRLESARFLGNKPDFKHHAIRQAKELVFHARSLETRCGGLHQALFELLEQVESLDGYQLTRDVEQYKAQACWDAALEQAAAALKEKA